MMTMPKTLHFLSRCLYAISLFFLICFVVKATVFLGSDDMSTAYQHTLKCMFCARFPAAPAVVARVEKEVRGFVLWILT